MVSARGTINFQKRALVAGRDGLGICVSCARRYKRMLLASKDFRFLRSKPRYEVDCVKKRSIDW